MGSDHVESLRQKHLISNRLNFFISTFKYFIRHWSAQKALIAATFLLWSAGPGWSSPTMYCVLMDISRLVHDTKILPSSDHPSPSCHAPTTHHSHHTTQSNIHRMCIWIIFYFEPSKKIIFKSCQPPNFWLEISNLLLEVGEVSWFS